MDYSNFHEIYQGGVDFKVLLVDKDTNSLMYMAKILEEHSYTVTTATHASIALSMIFERGSMFDLIISEIDMPGIDGFQFLNQITSKTAIPILLISTMEDTELTRRSLNEGAFFFFHKPIAPHNLVNIWQHILRYRMEKHPLNNKELLLNPIEVGKYFEVMHGNKNNPSPNLHKIMPLSKSLEIGNSRMIGTSTISNNNDQFISARNGNYIGENSQLGKRVREDDGNKFPSGSSTSSNSSNINKDEEKQNKKTQRLDWTPELQQKFKEVYEALGEHRATPTRIKQLMNVPGITTQKISSYLQKYRAKAKAQKDEETKHEMPTNIQNSTFNFQRCLGSYPPSMYSSRQFSRPNYSLIQTTGNLLNNVGLNCCNTPTEYPTQIVNVPNSSNIVTQVNFGPGLQPLEPFLQTWASHSPNKINLRENIGVSGVSTLIPGRNPQVVQEFNFGLGMSGDYIKASEFADQVPKGHGQNYGLGTERDATDMSHELNVDEIENLLQHFSDGDSNKYGSSPEGNVSSCSVACGNLIEAEMERYLTMLGVPANPDTGFRIP